MRETDNQTSIPNPQDNRSFLIPNQWQYDEPYASNDPDNPFTNRYRSVSVKELAQMWKRSKAIYVKPSTILKYDEIVKRHIIPILGERIASQIDTETIRNYILYKQNEGRLDGSGSLSASYVRTIAIVLKSILEFGSQENYCPAISLKRIIPAVSSKPPRTLSAADQKRLENYLSAHPCPTSIGILLGLRAGLRIGEVCALNGENIDLENKVISVRHTAVRVKGSKNNTIYLLDDPKTKASARDIPIADVLYQSLCIATKEGNGRYVASGSNHFVAPPTLEYRFHRMLEEAKIPHINFHALRHAA